MATTLILSSDDALSRLRQSIHAKSGNFYAMYSSILGGIVTDPALMVLPLDDHMVHRGHAVFDTATLTHGMLYQLDPHLDRFLRSAELARIPLPFPRERLRQIILETAAASGHVEGSVRYWLSAGPGGYGLGPAECIGSSFYVIVFKQEAYPESYYTEGLKVVTSHVPIKPPLFARIKSTNYLPNVLVVLEAKDRSADNGVFIDQRGMVAESSNMNVAFVSKERVFRHPPFDAILSGITIQRVLQFAERLVKEGELKEIRIADIPVSEGHQAAEMMLIGSSIKVAPVVQWDGQAIGDGKPGPITKKLLEMWNEDARSAADQLIAVPYPD
ncbi:MAG: D-amino-acid transaminase [Deltaproteobacteria bacterium]|nr:D-amino-acid transaminase [Deltaproteobacteria bacterium]